MNDFTQKELTKLADRFERIAAEQRDLRYLVILSSKLMDGCSLEDYTCLWECPERSALDRIGEMLFFDATHFMFDKTGSFRDFNEPMIRSISGKLCRAECSNGEVFIRSVFYAPDAQRGREVSLAALNDLARDARHFLVDTGLHKKLGIKIGCKGGYEQGNGYAHGWAASVIMTARYQNIPGLRATEYSAYLEINELDHSPNNRVTLTFGNPDPHKCSRQECGVSKPESQVLKSVLDGNVVYVLNSNLFSVSASVLRWLLANAESSPKAQPKRRGPKSKFNPQDDQKWYDDWQAAKASGSTKKEFVQSHTPKITGDCLEQTLARVRKRKRTNTLVKGEK